MTKRAIAAIVVSATAIGVAACTGASTSGSKPPIVDIPSASNSAPLAPLATASSSAAASGAACATDADCVPATCCHPKTCGPVAAKPSCDGVMCTMECRGGSLDCGGGHCVCQNGSCGVVITPRHLRVPPAASSP